MLPSTILYLLYTFVSIQVVNGQIAALLDDAVQAHNCEFWGRWGPCIWVKSGADRTRTSGPIHRWDRQFFEQLTPGRFGCRETDFFQILEQRFAIAFNNVFHYLRDMTEETLPCGMCSYQQSCGRECHRDYSLMKEGERFNYLFVAERVCSPDQLGGHNQNIACTTPGVVNNCSIWPSPNIAMPNVDENLRATVDSFDFSTCIRERRPNGFDVCRCCCSPYEPDPVTFECKANPATTVLANQRFTERPISKIDTEELVERITVARTIL